MNRSLIDVVVSQVGFETTLDDILHEDHEACLLGRRTVVGIRKLGWED